MFWNDLGSITKVFFSPLFSTNASLLFLMWVVRLSRRWLAGWLIMPTPNMLWDLRRDVIEV